MDLRPRATVDQKGRVCLPKQLREKAGVKPGSILEFEEYKGKLIIYILVK